WMIRRIGTRALPARCSARSRRCARTSAPAGKREAHGQWRRGPDIMAVRGRESGVATAVIDGIKTRYEVIGSGTPLLMFSAGGFDATLDKWTTLGIYGRTAMLSHLANAFKCIVFDRRETGESGGRVERITWAHYARQGYGLLQHLKIDRAHIMGGCMGCSPAAVFAVMHPEATRSLVLFWPVGGAKYRINGHLRFAEHLAFVKQHGLAEVVSLARSSHKSFGEDPRGGPWVSVLRRDAEFAASYTQHNVEQYLQL